MSSWARRHVDRVGKFDRAITRKVARLPATPVDRGLLRLTSSADHSALWMVCAATLATRKGTPRRAALRGVISIAGASFTVNAVLKTLLARRRPATDLLPAYRRLIPVPRSSSFPSGHSAAAAAFVTAVGLESPRAAMALAPVAAAVVYSRVHTGAHWGSDVLVGSAVGCGVALATRRWWPVRESDEARATLREAPMLPDGKGLLLLVNPASGDSNYDPADDIAEALPAATLLRTDPDRDAADLLEEALAASTEPVQALGVAGGDGTVAAVAAVAVRHGLPLAVVPTGTLNHFARDLGVYDLQEVVDATAVGEAVSVDIARVDYSDENDGRTRHLINTASLGAYPDLVRRRERWQRRWGKWPAFVAAVVATVAQAKPLEIDLDGDRRLVWFVFVGNGPYHPRGAVPAFRDILDSGQLDVRWLRADLPWSRTRAALALLASTIGRSKVYGERLTPGLVVRLPRAEPLATDGEVAGAADSLRFSMAGRLTVYRRDESNPLWANRFRPHNRRGAWFPSA
ncbi:phosphatase PAP2 family protein [Nocardia yunnanensis]|uniref:Phosphatase PAP2 family protein n=1 Tax=Nocardia yunnanensis TaxID=2382165 RepID=A0A386ZJI0_9NOCA|nr:bifunctional phosphatase PAP2/diacylglycerol kinase family protein [Nocardia yunnanensis]AYF77540.1 phosphatase PAP2 family protein [Nocardia yunnanensis]